MSRKAMTAEDELRELARLVKRMRQLQRQYFKTRDKGIIPACQRAEAQVDKAVESAIEFRTADIPWEQPAEAGAGGP